MSDADHRDRATTDDAWVGATSTHDWRISEREYARQEQRRGSRHAYAVLEPRHTALVVVDMVAFFAADNPYVRAVVPHIERLATVLRAAGGHVAWVLPESGSPTSWAREFYGEQVAARYAASGGSGTTADRLVPGLTVEHGDVVAEKSAPSAFFPGRSTLPAALADRGVDTVLVTGTVTNVCVEATARDAATLGHRTIVVADGCAAPDDRTHDAALHTLYRSYADVRTTDDLVTMLSR